MMKQNFRKGNRIISLLLVLVMLVGLMPHFAMEANAASATNSGITVTVDNVYCNYCNDFILCSKMKIKSVSLTGSTLTIVVEATTEPHGTASTHRKYRDEVTDTITITTTYFSCTSAYDNVDMSNWSWKAKGSNGSGYGSSIKVSRKAGHTVSSWTQSNNQHSGTCSFCKQTVTGKCSGGTATCIAPATCSTCKKSYGSLSSNNHQWGEWSSSGNTHSRTCALDSNHIQSSDHYGGNATCVKLAVCDACGVPYGEVNPEAHAPAAQWIYDNGYHYHECLYGCGTHVEETKCSGGNATCLEKAVCEICGNAYGEKNMNNHVSADTYYALIDVSTHGKYHSCCDTLIEAKEHNDAGAAATCTGLARCSDCESEYGEKAATAHTGKRHAVYVNPQRHYYMWDCCDVKEPLEDHTLTYTTDDENDTITATCTACKKAENVDTQGAYTLVAEGGTYTGYAIKANYTRDGIFNEGYYPLVFPTITYCCEGGCIKAGEHTATMTLGDAHVTKDFTIAKKPLTLTVQVKYKAYDGTNELQPWYGYELDGVVIYSLGYYEYYDFDDVRDDVKIDWTALTITAPDVIPGKYETVSVSGIYLSGEDADNYTIYDSSDSVPVKDWLGNDGVYIYKPTITIRPENQALQGDAELDQTAYEMDGLDEKFEISGIELYEEESTGKIAVKTENIKITLNGENVTKYFSFNTYEGNLSRVCEGHEFDANGFCATGKCETYEPAEEVIETDEYGNIEKVYCYIRNAGQLYWFAEQVNKYGRNDINGVLLADITVNEDLNGENLRTWTPIGSSYPPFVGDFEGNGYSISGLYFKNPAASYVGLFGGTDYNHPISNLGIKNSYFEGADNVGALAGQGGSIISNCYAENVEIVCDGSNSGALVGKNSGGTVENCYSNAGALVGYNAGTVENCYYLADEDTDGINGTTVATAAQFASGEIAYKLQAGVKGEEYYDPDLDDMVTEDPEEIWGQTIGEDAYPVLYGAKVYEVTNCKKGEYSNSETGDHVWNNGVCNVCDKTCDHSYTDGVCNVCGELAPLDFYGWSLTLQDNIALNYVVDAKFFADGCYTDPSVTFTMGNRTVTVSNYSTTKYDGYYTFTFTDIAPHQMGETVTAVLSAKNGEEMVTTKPAEYSVKTYCTNKLDAADSSDKLKTLVVDLLNYGAATQTYVDSTDVLVNADLTEEQKAFGTQDDVALETYSNPQYQTVNNPTVTWVGAYLTLTDAVEMKFVFSATSIDGLTVKVTTADPNASTAIGQTWTISEFQIYNDGQYSGYVANFDGFNADQMREIVYVTVYDADGNAVSNTYSYSIESYAVTKANEDGNLASLVKAMMKYGDSAKKFNS